MAADKNSFILYRDLIHTVRKLPKEKQAELFMHILSYVNDEDPVTDDMLIEIAFEPIKQSLKRDLKKYEKTVERNRNNGSLGGRPSKNTETQNNPVGFFETQTTQDNQLEPKKADSDSDNDTDSDILLKKEAKEILIPEAKEKKFNYREELLSLVDDEKLVNDYITLRKTKKASQTETALNGLKNECKKHNFKIADALRLSVEYNWQGFKVAWVKEKEKNNHNSNSDTHDRGQPSGDQPVLGRQTASTLQSNAGGWDKIE